MRLLSTAQTMSVYFEVVFDSHVDVIVLLRKRLLKLRFRANFEITSHFLRKTLNEFSQLNEFTEVGTSHYPRHSAISLLPYFFFDKISSRS